MSHDLDPEKKVTVRTSEDSELASPPHPNLGRLPAGSR